MIRQSKIHRLLTLWLPALILACSVIPAAADEKPLVIKFSDLAKLTREQGPQWRLIEYRTGRERLEAKGELVPSNPELSYTREAVKSKAGAAAPGEEEVEQAFTLSKSFEMPWIYAKKRGIHGLRKEALALAEETEKRELLHRVKLGYVTLVIMADKARTWERIKAALEEIEAVARSRGREGFLAGYEQQLIDIGLLNLNARILDSIHLRRETEIAWKALLGIHAHDPVELVTPVEFTPLALADPNDAEKLVQATPGYKRRRREIEILKKEIALEKMTALPGFTVGGGYKEVRPDMKGYEIEFSLELPLLDRNRTAVKARQLELAIAEEAFGLFVEEEVHEIHEKLRNAAEHGVLLAPMAKRIRSLARGMTPVVAAFREGSLSLEDFLNIQDTYLEGVEQYYLHLHHYFEIVFDLEVVTNRTLWPQS